MLKKIDIKNCTCYYFHDIIEIEDFDFGDILLDEKSYKNTLIYDIKNGNTYVISHGYAKIKIITCESLPLEKALTFHNAIIFIKSVFNEDRNYYYYNIFLEKCSCKQYKYAIL